MNNVSNALEFGGEVLSFFGAAGAGVGLKHVGRTVEGRFGGSGGSSSVGGTSNVGSSLHIELDILNNPHLTAREKLFGTNEVYVGDGKRVRPVNGRKPINSEYAGIVYEFDQLPESILSKNPTLKRDYQHGIPFTGSGFADFSRYAIKKVEIDVTGKNWIDFSAADKAAGFSKRPDGYTWHHVHDGKTMILVPEDLHAVMKHTGGVAIVKSKGSKNG